MNGDDFEGVNLHTDKPARRSPVSDAEYRSARARIGGIARAASRSPEDLSASGRLAAQARWARYRQDRIDAGLPETKKPRREQMSADELEFWLEQIDEKWPDKTWPNQMARRRAAELLAKEAAARIILEHRRREMT